MQQLSHALLERHRRFIHIWIQPRKHRRFFEDTADKAYTLWLLQEFLQLHPATELLAYSLTDHAIHILVFAPLDDADTLTHQWLLGYVDYLNDSGRHQSLPFINLFLTEVLAGPHAALLVSKSMHLLHTNWRNDRYSSIGFYIHDRRGSWMKPYRLARLFGGNANVYTAFMLGRITASDGIFGLINQAEHATLKHG